MMKANARSFALIALAFSLSACGAGTSNPPPNPPEDPKIVPGDLDETFGTKGMALYDDPIQGAISNEEGRRVAIQPDGKIVVAGYIQSSAPVFASALVLRYDASGVLDNTFGTDGVVTFDPAYRFLDGYGVSIQADGKIVVVGDSGLPDPNVVLARLNPDGTLDSTFGAGGVASFDVNDSDYGYAVAIQTDGKIVVVGETSIASDRYALVLRCNSDGTLDGAFGMGGIVTYDSPGWDSANGVAIQSDAKIVVTGSTSLPYPETSLTDLLVFRLNGDGTLDNAFGANGVATFDLIYDEGMSALIQPDGKIVIVGGVWSYSSAQDAVLVLRYKDDGTLDDSFGTGGVVTYNPDDADYKFGEGAALQTDGKIVVVGYICDSAGIDFLVLRYNPNGALDTTFGGDGMVEYKKGEGFSGGYGVAIQSDGKLVVSGNSTFHDQYSDYAVLVMRIIGRQ
jgi:uncharacterized delta-60 repeat protein